MLGTPPSGPAGARDETTRSVHTVDQENVSATLTVAVPAARVFAVLTDPTTHSAIDGTGWVQESVDRAPLTEVGQIFRICMYHPGHPEGHFRVANKVVVLDPPRAEDGRERFTDHHPAMPAPRSAFDLGRGPDASIPLSWRGVARTGWWLRRPAARLRRSARCGWRRW